jgi:hypothetical protein
MYGLQMTKYSRKAMQEEQVTKGEEESGELQASWF